MEKSHAHPFWKHACRWREIVVELAFKTLMPIRFYIGFCYKKFSCDDSRYNLGCIKRKYTACHRRSDTQHHTVSHYISSAIASGSTTSAACAREFHRASMTPFFCSAQRPCFVLDGTPFLDSSMLSFSAATISAALRSTDIPASRPPKNTLTLHKSVLLIVRIVAGAVPG